MSQYLTLLGVAAQAAAGGTPAQAGASAGDDFSGTALASVATAAVATTTGWDAVVFCRNNNNVFGVPTDTAGNVYTAIPGATVGGIDAAYLATNITGNASNIVSCNFPGTTGQFVSANVVYTSGTAVTTPVDVVSTGSGTLPTATSSAFSTAQANEIVILWVQDSGLGGSPITQVIGPSAGFPSGASNMTTAAMGPTGTDWSGTFVFSTVQTSIAAGITAASGSAYNLIVVSLHN